MVLYSDALPLYFHVVARVRVCGALQVGGSFVPLGIKFSRVEMCHLSGLGKCRMHVIR